MSDPGASRPAGDGADGDPRPAADQAAPAVAELSLGGGGQAIPYPALALDPDASGFWGGVDRATDRLTSLLNPILVKEARQSLKSKQFLITFFCLLAASCVWTIMGIVFNAPDVYYIPTGESMMIGYFMILSVSMFAFVPLVAFRSLAAELDEGTYEMLAITRLTAWRIVSGKMNSAVLQMLIYFSAIVPCLAFCYLLRGIGLLTIILVVAIIFITAMVLTALALVLSTLAKGRTLQTFLLVGLVAFIVVVEFTCCGFVFSLVLPEQWSGTWFGFLAWFTVAASFVVLFVGAAAARIAPVTENRSTRLRAILFFQQAIWVVTMAYTAWASGDFEWINDGLLYLGIFWLVVGMFMCGEASDLSPRVRRGLPATYGTRMLFTWWMPGPGTGFMFVVATGVAGLVVLAAVGVFGVRTGIAGGTSVDTPPPIFAAMMMGYLLGYLGIIRLLSMPFLKRFGPSFAAPLIAALVAYFLGVIVPAIIDVAIQGRVSFNYSALHASNWMWTWNEAFSSRGLPAEVAMLILAVGAGVLAINLIPLFREFRLRKIAVPLRVKQDLADESENQLVQSGGGR
ncbi:hypothetical protein Enr13x_72710 [Stieleria neptunia]|uniref:ABC-2 family transporter protein n=1 Tax=Stieleria neptunia TaxID=2527979 RepID=A0A518I2N5_9BACT|nr:ABC transporter permease [Stieleria neptunia]QDV47362.1 hypothetical protein Enr13x_72710 [Stieleria neptunia]